MYRKAVGGKLLYLPGQLSTPEGRPSCIILYREVGKFAVGPFSSVIQHGPPPPHTAPLELEMRSDILRGMMPLLYPALYTFEKTHSLHGIFFLPP